MTTNTGATFSLMHVAGEEFLPHTKWSRLDVTVNGTFKAKLTYTRPGCGATIMKLTDLETGTVVATREMGNHGFNMDVNNKVAREMVREALEEGWWV